MRRVRMLCIEVAAAELLGRPTHSVSVWHGPAVSARQVPPHCVHCAAYLGGDLPQA